MPITLSTRDPSFEAAFRRLLDAKRESAVDVDAWAREALSLGVVIRSGRMYDFDGGSQSYLRLGFTCHNERELQEAARRMATAKEHLGD